MGILNTAKIAELREKLSITQDEAAKRAEFKSRQHWNRIEAGRGGSITLDTLEKLAAALECSPSDLLIEPKKRKGKA